MDRNLSRKVAEDRNLSLNLRNKHHIRITKKFSLSNSTPIILTFQYFTINTISHAYTMVSVFVVVQRRKDCLHKHIIIILQWISYFFIVFINIIIQKETDTQSKHRKKTYHHTRVHTMSTSRSQLCTRLK